MSSSIRMSGCSVSPSTILIGKQSGIESWLVVPMPLPVIDDVRTRADASKLGRENLEVNPQMDLFLVG